MGLLFFLNCLLMVKIKATNVEINAQTSISWIKNLAVGESLEPFVMTFLSKRPSRRHYCNSEAVSFAICKRNFSNN